MSIRRLSEVIRLERAWSTRYPLFQRLIRLLASFLHLWLSIMLSVAGSAVKIVFLLLCLSFRMHISILSSGALLLR